MKTMTLVRIVTMAAAGSLVAASAAAKTPDGQTPAQEAVCSVLRGAAFGLCNAYCEAADCDGDTRADPRACARLRAEYGKRTALGVFPCDCRPDEVFDPRAGCILHAVRITRPGEAYGHHGDCDGWNGCGDAETCAQWACEINGYSELVSFGVNGPCTGFDVCHLFYSQGSIQWDWGNWCGVFGVSDIDCR
jgi:hypothetical protein